MINELTEKAFQATFGDGMTDITQMEIEDPVYIWDYIQLLADKGIIEETIVADENVDKVYRNNENTFDHIIIPTEKRNVLLTIVIDLKKKSIFGHKILNLNSLYGTTN